MNRKFNVGDRVRIIGSRAPGMVGRIAVITAGPVEYCTVNTKRWRGGVAYELDFPSPSDPSIPYGATPENIEPYYDGGEASSWSDCVWKPRELRV